MTPSHHAIAGFILAGGKSRRMGRDKALLPWLGSPMVLHLARLIQPLVSSVTIVGRPECFRPLGLRAIADRRPEAGPLAGIVSALAFTRSRWNLILACDLPCLPENWIRWLLARALDSHAQLIVPQTAQGMEPLAALYRRDCAAPLTAALAHGVRRISDAWGSLRVQTVVEQDWSAIVASSDFWRNLNTPEDYARACRDWGGADQSTDSPAGSIPASELARSCASS